MALLRHPDLPSGSSGLMGEADLQQTCSGLPSLTQTGHRPQRLRRVRDMGIGVVVGCKLPRPSRKRPSTRWAAVFGRWLLLPRRAGALFCVRALIPRTWGSLLSQLAFRCRCQSFPRASARERSANFRKHAPRRLLASRERQRGPASGTFTHCTGATEDSGAS